MKQFFLRTSIYVTTVISIVLTCTGPTVASNFERPKVTYVLPLKVDMPILSDTQYFSFRGVNAAKLTLRRLMQIDCNYVRQMIDKFPATLYRDVGLIILVQKALEGVEVKTMSPQMKEELVLAEMAKLVRQAGRYQEALDLLNSDLTIKDRVPSPMAACKILEDEKMDLLRQRYHFNQNKWNQALLDQITAGPEPKSLGDVLGAPDDDDD